MYSEYIRVAQKRRKKGFEFTVQKLHSKRPSSTTFIFVRWSFPLVLFRFPRLFSFSLILQFFLSVVCHDCHTREFSFGFSFQFYALIFVFDYNFLPLPLSVNCIFHAFIFICCLIFSGGLQRCTSGILCKFQSCVCVFVGRAMLEDKTFTFKRNPRQHEVNLWWFLLCFRQSPGIKWNCWAFF